MENQTQTLRPAGDQEEAWIQQVLNNSDMFGNLNFAVIGGAVRVNDAARPSWLVLLNISYTEAPVKALQATVEYFIQEMISITALDQDFGRVYMRPESLGDKINDLFANVDIDFAKYPKLSKKYFITAENKELFASNVSDNILNAIEQSGIPEFEIVGNVLLVRFMAPYTEEINQQMLNFLYAIKAG